MTKEIAIHNLFALKLRSRVTSDREALDMAIKALEQQPCEDCISREAVEKITWEEPSYDDALNVLTEVRDKVRALPSVTPKTVTDFADKCKECGKIINDKLQTRWIPVSEGLPKGGQRVLVADRYEAVTTALYFGESPFWREMIVAWMPLPQPYKAESEEC